LPFSFLTGGAMGGKLSGFTLKLNSFYP